MLDEALQQTSDAQTCLDQLEEQVMNLLHVIDIHQNKPKLSQSWNASGKEKSDRTHTKLGLNSQGGFGSTQILYQI